MILSPVSLSDLPAAINSFAASLADNKTAHTVFGRIAATLNYVTNGNLELSQCPRQCEEAVDLALSFGMSVRYQPPAEGFTWDGHALSVCMEPSVIVHDVAHWQVCSPERRHTPDFGLGAGPETGFKIEADAWMTVGSIQREMEESLASLLGILWEVELRHPAILAFLEQNWLEGGTSPHNRQHFLKVLGHLQHYGLLDSNGHPTTELRTTPDAEFLDIFVA